MEKRPSFIDRLKAKFFKKPEESVLKSTDLSQTENMRRGSGMLPLIDVGNKPQHVNHSVKQNNRVQLEAIDHNVSNQKIADIINGRDQRQSLLLEKTGHK